MVVPRRGRGGGARGAGASSIRLGDGKGVEREVGNACCASQRRRRGARAQVGWRRGAWHDALSPWRFERPSSACAQGNGAAWRGREASGRNRGWGGGFGRGGRCMAGDAGVVTTPPQRERKKTEEGEGWSEGNSVNRAKFKISFCKLNFSPLSWSQMKNF